MKKKLIALLFACSLAISGIAQAEEYIMCPGDQLDITVLGHEDISTVVSAPTGKYIVRPDGKLSFPLIGEVDITGMTIAQFTQTLEQRLSEYLVKPQVTVNIAQLGTTRVYVLGEVNKPGLYELTKSHKLLDAIGAANGFTKDAAKKKVFLVHKDHKGEPIKLNLNNILKKGDVSQNYTLVEGDLLYLTSNGRIDFAKDILPFISSAYMVSEIQDNN
ncbi:MAG: polysaccharide biosynthesis/export family protein [Acidaminococcaceae bacterium]